MVIPSLPPSEPEWAVVERVDGQISLETVRSWHWTQHDARLELQSIIDTESKTMMPYAMNDLTHSDQWRNCFDDKQRIELIRETVDRTRSALAVRYVVARRQ